MLAIRTAQLESERMVTHAMNVVCAREKELTALYTHDLHGAKWAQEWVSRSMPESTASVLEAL